MTTALASATVPQGIPRGLLRFSNGVLLTAAAFCALVAAYTRLVGQPWPLTAAILVAGILSAACLRLPAVVRVNLALSALGAILALYTVEVCFTFLWSPISAQKFRAPVAHFDTRSGLEVVADLRSQGIDAHPSLFGRLPMVYGRNTLPSRAGEILPLGGISDRLTVFCNESGQYVTYRSDQFGFNNPRQVWSAGKMTIGSVGDSFTQGTCVSPGRSFVSLIQQKYPATLNLGMSGSGPLLELAALEEYLTVVKPAIVLWFYFDANDLVDLSAERTSPLLMRYLQSDFRQDLPARQAVIDRAWLDFEQELNAEFAKRQVQAPLRPAMNWLNDVLVEHRNRSTLTRILRLREIRARLAARFAVRTPEESQIPLLGEVLAKARDTTRSWGGQLYFVALPGMEVLLGRNPLRVHLYRLVIQKAGSLGIPVIDARDTLRSRDVASLFYYPDSHYNETGAGLVAQSVLSVLAPQLRQ